MRLVTRVAAVALVVGSLSGALALRPAPAPSSARPTSEPAVQAAAVTEAQLLASRTEAASRTSALLAARTTLARRHQAYLTARSQLAAARARAAAASRVTVAAAKPATTTTVTQPVVHRTTTVSSTPSTTSSSSSTSPLTRAQRIYAGFHYDISRLGYRIVFKPSAAGLLGLTDSGTRTITVYVRSTESDLVLAHTIAHEMGHAVDFTRGTRLKHQQYQAIRHITRSVDLWYGCNGCTDYTTSAGDWAEVFAQWLAGPGDFRSRMAPTPTRSQLLLLAPMFRL